MESKIFDPFEDPYLSGSPSLSIIEGGFGKNVEDERSEIGLISLNKEFSEEIAIDEKGRRVFKLGDYRFVELLNNKEDQRLHYEGIVRFLNRFKKNEDDCIQNIYQLRSIYNSNVNRKQNREYDFGVMAVFDKNDNYVAQFAGYQFKHEDYKKPFLRAVFRTSKRNGEDDLSLLNLIKIITDFFDKKFYMISNVNSASINIILLYYYSNWFFLSKVKHLHPDSGQNVVYDIILSKKSIMDILNIEELSSDKEIFNEISRVLINNPKSHDKLKKDLSSIIDHYLKL